MNINYFNFEKSIFHLENKLLTIKIKNKKNITLLKKEIKIKTKKTIDNMSCSDIINIARHPMRPYFSDYIKKIFHNFQELHGDRKFSDDKAIIGGFAKIDNKSVLILGHQKGRKIKEKIKHNFGMPHPEGYRKSLRLFKLAEKFHIPIITFIDTPGAYPGIEAEERGQSEAIAKNLLIMSKLKTIIISIIIGESCSGGAIGISFCDKISMLQYSYFSIINPEGLYAILYKEKKSEFNILNLMNITSKELLKIDVINEIIQEPPGGAHRNFEFITSNIKKSIIKNLNYLSSFSIDELILNRYKKIINLSNKI
ncbi:MAG: acetyl-CoA carboxylase carboxyltransferase subunit alpha [Enterobacteriaceae bacterium]|nr:acetyl-CoA carboxylase carboxyltransferase subunit alpha [Enterobacteriaceae bacterium]